MQRHIKVVITVEFKLHHRITHGDRTSDDTRQKRLLDESDALKTNKVLSITSESSYMGESLWYL